MRLTPTKNDQVLRAGILLLFGLALLAFGVSAFAQGIPEPLRQVDPTDYSLAVILKSIFGEAAIKTGGDAGVLKGLFSAFNLGVVAGGTVLFAYVSVIGTLSTAADGELLGKKWSTMWVPLRFVGGVALILPGSGGLSVIQVIMLSIVGLGATFASFVWNGFITSYSKEMGTSATVSIQRQALVPIAEGMLKAEACLKGLADHAGEMPPETAMANGIGVSSSLRDNQISLEWGQPRTLTKFWLGPDQCGRLVYSYGKTASLMWSDNKVNGLYGEFDVSGSGGTSVPGVGSVTALANVYSRSSSIEAILAQGHIRGIQAMWAQVRSVGVKLGTASEAKPTASEINDAINKGVDAYYKELLSAANGSSLQSQISDSIKTLLESKGRGWIFAGMYFYDISRMNDRITSVARKGPTITGMKDDNLPAAVQDRIREVKAAVDSSIVAAKASNPSTLAALSIDDLKSGSITDKLIKTVFSGANAWQVVSGDTDNVSLNPLIRIKKAGDNMMYTAEVVWGAKVAAEAITAVGGGVAMTNWFSDKAGGSGVFSALWQVFQNNIGTPLLVAIFSLFVFGATLAIYLPMVPFIYWMVGVAGWLIVVIEAVVAAPLWAMMHMHPQGDGVAGDHAKAGYMLVLEIFMRPTMMVIGLAFAMILMYPITYLIFGTFFTYADSTQVDSIYGLFTWLGKAAIFAGLLVTAIHKSFGLIHIIPEKVMEWIGGHARPDNPEGKDDSRGAFVAAAGVSNKYLAGEFKPKPDGSGGGPRPRGGGGGDKSSGATPATPSPESASVSSTTRGVDTPDKH